MSPAATNVLYHVVNERHLGRRPLILTTNKALSTWGEVLHDPELADAIIDCILKHGRFLTLDGPSMRTRHLDGGESVEPARVSGLRASENPEPTATLPIRWRTEPTAAGRVLYDDDGRFKWLLARLRRVHERGDRAHEGKITTEAPNEMWGTDGTRIWTQDDGYVWFFCAIDHCAGDVVGHHVVKRGDRFAALEPVRQGVRDYFGGIRADVAYSDETGHPFRGIRAAVGV